MGLKKLSSDIIGTYVEISSVEMEYENIHKISTANDVDKRIYHIY